MPRKCIDQIDVASRTVLMRVDFNLPLDAEGAIFDDRRVRLALPSIKSVIERGGRLVLMSHLGRPKGAGFETMFSLKPAADRLRELLSDVSVVLPGDDCVSAGAASAVANMKNGEIVVLENLRFHPGEKSGDVEFASQLATGADIYCNEAFGTAHRSDASMVAVPTAMAGKPRVVGLLVQRELKYLGEVIRNPQRPFVAVLGGAKVSDKLGAIANLIDTVDTILIGGAMAYTLQKAQGHEAGDSLFEPDMIDQAGEIIDAAAASRTELILPMDHVCGREISSETPLEVTPGPNIAAGWMGLDIGPRTREIYAERLRSARTIVWNGPVGVFETPPFDEGTNQLARAIIDATEGGAISVIGGGETAAAAEALGLAAQFSHVSTGGGASLHMLEGRQFASVDLLNEGS